MTKIKLFGVCAALFAGLLTFATPQLSAQNREGVSVKFEAPVVAASTTLQAGEYTISLAPSQSDVPVLAFRNANGGVVFVLADRIDYNAAENLSVRLERRGDSLVVETVRMPEGSFRLVGAPRS